MLWYDNPHAMKIVIESTSERSPKHGRRQLRLIDAFGTGI